MTRYSKDDVEMHSDRGPRRPAVNVKCYRFPDSYKVAEYFSADPESAEVEKAMQYAFEMRQDVFWEDAQRDASEIFGSHVKVYSQGRSGGWLVVQGLKDFDDWNAIDLAKWRKFERWCKGNVPDRSDSWLQEIIYDIEANTWLETPDARAERERSEALSTLTEIA